MAFSLAAKSDDTNRVGSDSFAGNTFGDFEVVDPLMTLAVLAVVGLAAFFILKKAKAI